MDTLQQKLFSKFLLVWFGQLISNIGSGLTAFTLGILVLQQTQSPTSYAMVIFCSFMPSLLLKPVGGVLADRFDRRLMMILGDAGSAFGLIFILTFVLMGSLEVWHIYVGASISSIFGALHNPAYKASVTDFVSEEKYTQASGLMQLASTSQFLVSPVLAGILITIMDIKYILVIDILSFIIAALLVVWVRSNRVVAEQAEHQNHHVEEQVKLSFWRELKEGMRTINANKGIVVLITLTSVLCFYIGFLQTLLAPMMLNFTDPKTYGISLSVCASGLLVSSLLISIFGGIKKHVATMTVCLVFVGLFYSFIGVSTNVYVIVVSGFLFFFALAFVQTSLEVLIRQNIDNTVQGRVWSLISVATQLGYPIAYVLSGVLAEHVFNPLLVEGGLLATSVGSIIGIGPGRGIGFMFIVFGILIAFLSFVTGRTKVIKELESNAVDEK